MIKIPLKDTITLIYIESLLFYLKLKSFNYSQYFIANVFYFNFNG